MPIALNGSIIISIEESDNYFDFIHTAPGHVKIMDSGAIIAAATGSNLRCFRELYPNIEIFDRDGTISRLEPKSISEVDLSSSPSLKFKDGIEFFDHQKNHLKIVSNRNYYGFWHEQGAGKSAEIITGACQLFLLKKVKQVLIVTRLRAIPQYLKYQIPTYAPTNIELKAFELPTTKEVPILSSNRLCFAITAITSFQTPSPKKSRNISSKPRAPTTMLQIIEYCKRAPTALFIDESHEFSGWSTLRIDNLKLILQYTSHRFLYSGEPKPRDYINLFSQFWIMNPDILGHAGITSFKNEFCRYEKESIYVKGGNKRDIPVFKGYNNEDRFAALIAPHCEYVKLNDMTKNGKKTTMPPQFFEPAHFTPSAKQKDLYENMKKNFIATVTTGAYDDNEVQRVCRTAGTQLITLQMIADGWFYGDVSKIEYTDEEIESGKPTTNKLKVRGPLCIISDERAEFVIEEKVASAPKVIIWAAFHEDLSSLVRVLEQKEIPFVEYSGRIENKQLELNKHRFINDEKCRVWIGTESMGGTALDGLQIANRMIWFSHTYNYGIYDQAIHRIWRTGQTQPCFYSSIIGFGIDQMKRANLQSKKSLSQRIMDLVELKKMMEEI